jgi:hypothetical protein
MPKFYLHIMDGLEAEIDANFATATTSLTAFSMLCPSSPIKAFQPRTESS